ncbi:MAG TPA: hypothetical protein PKA28_18465 [Methylomusa anaerophila]|uniref:Allene oxide cyclase barrel-like domain-containing protein n=1 Tax=Methylomusa anaerophila TaxID=1930071 RepID=A0A348AIQ3_9FIRM|nr:hypothetical protein [Methylomusa anaerophila]BBB90951.1 hypothetical protein MAMMFC1_01618 [Methylomusa anaerophila]HML90422.1 hypothetical protein [Methylomusa anaerophila]
MVNKSPAAAQTLQFEVTNYIVSSEWLPVEDEDGHVLGVQKREGNAVFTNRENAKYSFVGAFDVPYGRDGIANGYTKLDFADGSVIMLAWTSALPWVDGQLPSNKGQGTIIKGTGRFEGIRGTSVFSGRQLKPASQDPKFTAVANVTLTYTLP